ncbi:MAG: hypothetical protein Q4G42_03385 [Neisseria sp.]|nr:hypothetical protein [Neisseria sp.]
MLSSRYIHLHEALGLGPLWLKRGAQVQGAKARGTGKPAPRLPESEEPKFSAEKVQSMIARLAPAAESTGTAPAKPAEDSDIHLAVRLVYALTQNDGGSVLWLTLRSSLNAPAHDIGHGEFGKLLKQLIYACAHTDAVWNSLGVHEEAPLAGCLNLLAQHREARVVLLGEDIEQLLSTHTTLPENTLTVPHPARLLRQSALKKETWQRLSAFFFGEKT